MQGLYVQYRPDPGNMSEVMQDIRLPPGNMSQVIQSIQIIQIREISALKDLDREVGINDLSKMWKHSSIDGVRSLPQYSTYFVLDPEDHPSYRPTSKRCLTNSSMARPLTQSSL